MIPARGYGRNVTDGLHGYLNPRHRGSPRRGHDVAQRGGAHGGQILKRHGGLPVYVIDTGRFAVFLRRVTELPIYIALIPGSDERFDVGGIGDLSAPESL